MSRVLTHAHRTVFARGGSIAAVRPRTISTCARALLDWHGIDPLDAMPDRDVGNAAIRITDVQDHDGHLTMTVSLPMAYGDARMTVRTGDDASIAFPGMRLSPAMTAATIGRPIGRLAGHPAFDTLDLLRVTAVRYEDQTGRPTMVVSFEDTADAIVGTHEAAALVQ